MLEPVSVALRQYSFIRVERLIKIDLLPMKMVICIPLLFFLLFKKASEIHMLQILHHRHRRSLSVAFMVMMLLSVLQFCLMSVAEAQVTHHQGESFSDYVVTAELSHAGSAENAESLHDCCAIDAKPTVAMEAACPDCENDSEVLQTSAGPDLKPLFSLLYIVVQEVLNQTTNVRFWQQFTEPDILSSLPDIYLANVSFLE
ncbi:hypothetical protein GV64_09495 [Endozoicomonas elysicola]|uniref:Uncharacterized protein n=2 Tax=Endozoicomonas elysicola TaxID=305900 RepID=A0A081K9W3_9GAMM|nr:hypothetical protein GV64_09495 [Endozoicomonas elysicola]